MAQVDASIPMRVRSFDLGELADSYTMAQKFQDDMKNSALSRQSATQGLDLAKKQDARATSAEGRAQSQEIRTQTNFSEDLKTLSEERKAKRRKLLGSMLGEEAEVISGMDPVKRKEYYKTHLLPGLKDEGFDTSDMEPDFDDNMIESWRMLALDPKDRLDYREKKNAPPKLPDPQLKVDETGRYVPVSPATGLNAVTGRPVKAAPQQFMMPGEGGIFSVTAPRGGQATASPVTMPGASTQLQAPLKQVPDKVKEDIRSNEGQKRTVKMLIDEVRTLKESPTSPGKEFVRGAVPFGGAMVDSYDPSGMKARQLIGKLSSITIKDVSGASVTASEFPRLSQWIPQVGDTKEQATSKLLNFEKELDSINKELGQQYSREQGFREDPLLKSPSNSGGAKPWQRKW